MSQVKQNPTDARDISRLAEVLASARRLAAFTGAGVSTESGIPDYRSPGGLWQTHRPPVLQEFLVSREARLAYWRFYQASFPAMAAARPNPGHRALGRLHAAGRLAGVITQNIDGLHLAGGVPAADIMELHGNAHLTTCLSCGREHGETAAILARFGQSEFEPVCASCGGPLKPATISFGQGLNPETLGRAARISAEADVMLVMGSSLTVSPAADLPRLTLEAGGRLVIINREPTPLDDAAELVIHGPAGATLGAAVEAIFD